LISVVGKHWLTATDEDAKRRLDSLDDFVRLEIATALKRGIRVIPVLVDGASMPRSADLPDELKTLVRLQALKVSQDRFRSDSEPLITAVDQALKEARAERQKRGLTSPGKKMWLSIAGVMTVLTLVVVAASLYFASRRPQARPTTSEPMVRGSVSASTPGPSLESETLKLAVQPSAQPTARFVAAIPNPSISLTPIREELLRTSLQAATKDQPWVNSIEMKFVPVPGTQVLFSVWDTRVQDFETFVKSTGYDATGDMTSFRKDGKKGATWKEPGFSQGSTHPVVGVSWDDAEEFCRWLTKRERSTGDLAEDREYRLPKDEEWSAAVGLKNEVGSTPEKKDGKIKVYPWDIPQKRDKSWPPPKGAGNYCGEESKVQTNDFIKGYKDDYMYTNPVGSFAANQFGLYDMGGNVWQWCEDVYDLEFGRLVLRGASWFNAEPGALIASNRGYSTPYIRNDIIGFRCVVAVESSR
jgi:hypothetical protein